MDRPRTTAASGVPCSPHTRGDGPVARGGDYGRKVVVPTRVGMDRIREFFSLPGGVVPTRVGMDQDYAALLTSPNLA